MRTRSSILLRAAIVGIVSATALAQAPVAVIYQPNVGTKSVINLTIDSKFDIGGQAITFHVEQTSEETVANVEPDGRVTVKSKTTKSSTAINGEIQGEDPVGSTSEYTYASNGAMVGAKPASDDDETGPRINQATAVVLPSGQIAAGATWTHSYAGGGNLVKGEFSGKAEAFESKNGVNAVRIASTYAEKGTDEEMTVKATSWVEVEDGTLVAQTFELEGLPIPIPGRPIFKGQMNRASKAGGSATATEAVSDQEAPDQEMGEIDEAVEGYEKFEGALTLYRMREDGDDSVYMEIPRDLLDDWMMMQATASTGTSLQVVTGMPLMDILFKFQEVQPGRITMVVPSYAWRADEDLPIATTLNRSFSRSFLQTFDIEAEQDGRILIDVTDFFKSDIISLNALMMGGGNPFGGGGSFTPDRDNSFIDEVKSFPENIAVKSVYAYEGNGVRGGVEEGVFGPPGLSGDARSVVIDVVYNMFPLPLNNGFVPRMYDERVGYFTVGYENFNDNLAVDRRVRYILRWNLEKKNASARISDPVKPIVFYLDKGIPEEFRESVANGILSWNPAMEAAGFSNAIQVRQMTEDDDFDHADMRYNVIRWVASPGDAYAVAQFRFNPLTGEALNASITVDLNYITYEVNAVEELIKFNDRPTNRNTARSLCDICDLGRLDRATAATFLQAESDDATKARYLREAIEHTVAHEFGHILGLRHNFIASTQLTLAQMADPAMVGRYGTTSSVMDYVPFNPHALKNDKLPFYTLPGDYDRWAVAYGYTSVPGTDPVQVHNLQQGLLNQAGQSGLAYRTDQHADSFDPYVARFDLSKEPLDYYTFMIDEVNRAMGSLLENGVARGESYYELTKAFEALVNQYAGSAIRATNSVGGIQVRQGIRGTSIDRPTQVPVAAATQRRALNFVVQNVFSEKAFNFPKEIYRFLGEDPRDDYAISGAGGLADFNVQAMYSRLTGLVFSNLFGAPNLTRLSGIEYKALPGEDTLTVNELMTSVGKQVWSEYSEGTAVTSLRRELQRTHLARLIDLGIRDGAGPSDAKVIALGELRRIKSLLEGAGSRYSDPYTKMHIADMLSRVTRALQASEVIGMGGGGGSVDLLQLLLGGRETTTARP
ncbi:MAG: zinc-dependent metalloprotease [Fimbriimonadaceae bacterium]|nr:zinc-dependent metalloprotease [Fimbriimonadaceae bacterium]